MHHKFWQLCGFSILPPASMQICVKFGKFLCSPYLISWDEHIESMFCHRLQLGDDPSPGPWKSTLVIHLYCRNHRKIWRKWITPETHSERPVNYSKVYKRLIKSSLMEAQALLTSPFDARFDTKRHFCGHSNGDPTPLSLNLSLSVPVWPTLKSYHIGRHFWLWKSSREHLSRLIILLWGLRATSPPLCELQKKLFCSWYRELSFKVKIHV